MDVKQNRLLLLFLFKIIGCLILIGIITNQLEIKRYREYLISKYIFYNNTSPPITKVVAVNYVDIHEQIVLNRTKQKVIFFKIKTVGYGNLVYTMITALLAAIISDSALLIDWPSIDNYIDCPFVNVFKKFDDNSFLDFNQKSPNICALAAVTTNTWSINKQIGFLQDLRIPDNCTRYYISDLTPYFFDLAANIEYAEKLVLQRFVRNQTVEIAKKALKKWTLSKKKKTEILYQIGFEFAGNVLNNYWFLKPTLQDKVNHFIKQNFLGNFVIGIQMRFDFLGQEDIKAFVRCAREIEKKNKSIIGNRTVKWFISTDQLSEIQHLIKKYSSKILIGEGKIGHVASEPDAYERCILDIELLSNCNEQILTGGSTFGFIASIKSQKRPYFVEGKRSMHMCKIFKFYAPPRTPLGYASFR